MVTILQLGLIGQILANNDIFKINKLNLIWIKAQHSLGPDKLKDLKNDLSKQELDELTLKKMKTHNQDKDGMLETAVKKRLLSIMTRYSLDRYFEDIHGDLDPRADAEKSNFFDEQPVNNLWSAAIQANFSATELEMLREELGHYETRIKKLNHYKVQLEPDLWSAKLSYNEPNDETKRLKKKVKELTYKVDKIHKSLEKKIATRRDEL